jgi:hypothetical protein
MSMQDNEMDDLFRSKLDAYELEPSANVWANISREIGPVKRKNYAPLLRIAASVVVLIAAGLFFLPKKQVVEAPKNNKLATNTVTKTPATPQNGTIESSTPATPVQQVVNTKPAQQIVAVAHKVAPVTKVNVKSIDNTAKQPEVVNNPQPVTAIAAVTEKPADVQHALPEGPIKLVEAVDNPVSKTVLASANTDMPGDIKTPAKKHKIRGLGGLLNAAVSLIDRRDDKIIEFTDTDEGDSVTGLNLGILKVKKNK